MTSKLGPHCLPSSDGALQLVKAGCNVVKMVSDFGAAAQYLQINPNLIIVGRVYSSFDAASQRNESPEDAAARFIASQVDTYRLNPLIKIWEGQNEFVCSRAEDMAWYAAYESARVRQMVTLGLRCVIGNFSTGNPDLSLWEFFLPAIYTALQYNGILGLHEYSSPFMWWMTGKFQLDLNSDAGDTGWTTLRYRKVIRDYLKPAGVDDIPIVITECGLDRVGQVRGGMSSGNWRTNAAWWNAENSAGGPIPFESDAEKYYAEQLMWYDRELQKDASVIGATIFTVGSYGSPWDQYDINGTRVIQYLSEHIKNSAGNVTIPPSVVIVPPIVSPPIGNLPMEVNLLQNGSFEDKYYHADDVPEFAIPNKWDFWYQSYLDLRLPNQATSFLPPEMVVWDQPHAPENEKNLFWLDGIYCLKGFKGWGAIWFGLSQKVTGLVVGAKYKFTVPVFPDLVMKYEGGHKVFADDMRAGECLLSAYSNQALTDTGWVNGAVMKFGQYNMMSLEFVADRPEITVRLQLRGRYGLLSNGFFLDNLSLVKIADPVGTIPVPPVVDGEGSNAFSNPNFIQVVAGERVYLQQPDLPVPHWWRVGWVEQPNGDYRAVVPGFVTPLESQTPIALAKPECYLDENGFNMGGAYRPIWCWIQQDVTLVPGVYKVAADLSFVNGDLNPLSHETRIQFGNQRSLWGTSSGEFTIGGGTFSVGVEFRGSFGLPDNFVILRGLVLQKVGEVVIPPIIIPPVIVPPVIVPPPVVIPPIVAVPVESELLATAVEYRAIRTIIWMALKLLDRASVMLVPKVNFETGANVSYATLLVAIRELLKSMIG